MAAKSENPGMWINPKSNMHGGNHRTAYGEGQSTHNSRFLELADVVLSLNQPATKGAGNLPLGLAIAKNNLLLFRQREPVIFSDSTHDWSNKRYK
jgi:hypothetical protein